MGYIISSEKVDVAGALGNLSSALDVVSTIGKQVEHRYKELEKWEENLRALEKEIAKREAELKAREEKLQQCEKKPDADEADGGIRAERIVRGTLRDCKFSTKILLNVGTYTTLP